MAGIAAVLLVFLLLLIAYFMPITLRVEYAYAGNQHRLSISAYLPGGFRIWSKQYDRAVNAGGTSPGSLLENLNKVAEMLERLGDLLSTLTVSEIEWWTRLGTDDPAQTAILTGVAWGIKGAVVAFLRQHINMPQEALSFHIYPMFSKTELSTRFRCTLLARFGQIVLADRQIRGRRLRRISPQRAGNIMLDNLRSMRRKEAGELE
ncbi:MAG: DUF2953 domain-containing protein [Bacillota bacterium]